MVKRSNERNTRACLAGPTVASQKVSLSRYLLRMRV